jgi:hypothetical protein
MADAHEQMARALGAWRPRRLANQWSPGPVRAAALVRQPDYIKFGLDATGVPELSARLSLPPELRELPNAAVKALPDMQLLVLDQLDTLHLVALRGWTVGRIDRELMRWPVRDVTLTVKPGKGKFRAVEIVSGETKLMLAGPWKNDSQREALELIERETASARAIRG